MKDDIWLIVEDKDKPLQDRMKQLGMPRLEIWLNRIQHLPMLMFGTGVMVIVIAVFLAKGVPVMLNLSADWVEPLQAVLAVAGSWLLAFGIKNMIEMRIGG